MQDTYIYHILTTTTIFQISREQTITSKSAPQPFSALEMLLGLVKAEFQNAPWSGAACLVTAGWVTVHVQKNFSLS